MDTQVRVTTHASYPPPAKPNNTTTRTPFHPHQHTNTPPRAGARKATGCAKHGGNATRQTHAPAVSRRSDFTVSGAAAVAAVAPSAAPPTPPPSNRPGAGAGATAPTDCAPIMRLTLAMRTMPPATGRGGAGTGAPTAGTAAGGSCGGTEPGQPPANPAGAGPVVTGTPMAEGRVMGTPGAGAGATTPALAAAARRARICWNVF